MRRAETTTATPPADAGAGPRLAYSDADLDRLGLLSRKTRWRMRRAGTFPQPVAAGGRKLYRAADVHAWLADPAAWAREHGNGTGH
jgi:predicted DNA-binding transcriptional regulator AlpA